MNLKKNEKIKQQIDDKETQEEEMDLESIGDPGLDISLTNKGIIILEDEVNGKSTLSYVRKSLFEAATNGCKQISLYINSYGGPVVDFLSVHDTIILIRKYCGIEINTIVNGCAASGAALVLQAGSKRFATPNSVVLLHEMQSHMSGNSTKIDELKNQSQKLESIAFKIWANKMGISIKELKEMLANKDVMFDAKQAKKAGLIDKII